MTELSITSRKFIRVVDGEIAFTEQHLLLIAREELDRMAAELAIEDPPTLLYPGTGSRGMSLRHVEE